jgi:hypothetical protein
MTTGWYPVPAPAVPLVLADRPPIFYANQGLKRKARLAYAHAHPDPSAGQYTPARISDLSPAAEVDPGCSSWHFNLRWAGSTPDTPAPAVLVFVQYDGDPNWWCSAAPKQHGHGFFFPLRGPGDWAQGGHAGGWTGGNWWRPEDFPHDPTLTTPTAAPMVTLHDLPNLPFEVTYSYRVLNGETALAPVTRLPTRADAPADWYCPAVTKLLAPTPPGVYGLYVYLRRKGETVWHRQPWHHGRQCWPSWMSELRITRFRPTGIAPQPVAEPLCWLNDLQERLAFGTATDCTTDADDMPLVCPLVSPLTGKARTVGGRWGRVAFSIPAAVTREGVTYPVPREWDAIIQEESNKTTWRNLEVRGDIGGIDALAGFATHSYSAGNCFGLRLEHGSIIPNGQRFSVGLAVSQYSNGNLVNDHTASEMRLDDFYFGAHVNHSVSGQQSVNFTFHQPGAYPWRASPCPDDCAFHFCVQNGQYVISGSFDPSQHAAVFALDTETTLFVSDLFADNLGRALVTAAAAGAVKFTGAGKLNCFRSQPYTVHLLEQYGGTAPFRLDLGDIAGQDNGNVTWCADCGDAAAVTVTATPGAFFDGKVVMVAGWSTVAPTR